MTTYQILESIELCEYDAYLIKIFVIKFVYLDHMIIYIHFN